MMSDVDDMLSILIGGFAIGIGVLGVLYPQRLFRLQYFHMVSSDSELSETGVLLYRVGGVFSVLVGLWVMIAWGRPLGTLF